MSGQGPDPRSCGAGFHWDGAGVPTTLHPGIDCGGDCDEALAVGTTARLALAPDPPYGLYKWTGDADCEDGVVTLEAHRHCIALVPEPGAPAAFGAGLVGLVWLARRRRPGRRGYAGRGRMRQDRHI
jgi:hypothetical protein